MKEITEIAVHILGYTLIWYAVQIGRKENQLMINQRNWWVATLLIIFGSVFLRVNF